MARLVATNCPECNAKLKVDPESVQVKCEFCGTTALIESKKRKTAQMPAAGSGQEVPVIQLSSGIRKGVLAGVLLVFAVPLLIGGFITYMTVRRGMDGAQAAPEGFLGGASFQWAGNKQAMLYDANRDGVLDPIGWVRFKSNLKREELAAFNAISGEMIWSSGPQIEGNQGHHAKTALVEGMLLLGDPNGVLKGFSPTNGKLLWSTILGERVETFCGLEEGYIQVRTTDNRVLKATLATGQVMPIGKVDENAPCNHLMSHGTVKGMYSHLVERPGWWNEIPSPIIEGMDVEKIVVDTTNEMHVALGSKKEGTRIPVAAMYFSSEVERTKKRSSRKVQVQWQKLIPAVNPLTVSEGGPDYGLVSVGRLVIPYALQRSGHGYRLAALNMNTGQSLWDVAIPKSDTGLVNGIVASDRQVFVSMWTYLHVFDLGTGTYQRTIGGW